MDTENIRLAILNWAHSNGILSDNVIYEGGGDIELVPFENDDVDFFRTRKIVRIEDEKDKITIFSRLPIAKTKRAKLQNQFNQEYAEYGISLIVDYSKPFKIDQAVQAFGRFEPIRFHGDSICCGSSIGLGNQRNAGTLSALARDESGTLFGLSCNHVVGGCSIAQPGTPVVSPGIQDVSVENKHIHMIGEYVRPAPMAQGLPSVIRTARNQDLACFEIPDEKKVSSLQGSGDGSFDTPVDFVIPDIGTPVKKWGRSTGLTFGEVSYIGKGKRPEPIEYNITCYYGPMNSQIFKGTVYYNVVYEVTPTGPPFSLGGDSGALVVTDYLDKEEKVIGIVIAGERRKSILLPLEPAIDELGLHLVSGHNI